MESLLRAESVSDRLEGREDYVADTVAGLAHHSAGVAGVCWRWSAGGISRFVGTRGVGRQGLSGFLSRASGGESERARDDRCGQNQAEGSLLIHRLEAIGPSPRFQRIAFGRRESPAES
jgi:hypothetical protein